MLNRPENEQENALVGQVFPVVMAYGMKWLSALLGVSAVGYFVNILVFF